MLIVIITVIALLLTVIIGIIIGLSSEPLTLNPELCALTDVSPKADFLKLSIKRS